MSLISFSDLPLSSAASAWTTAGFRSASAFKPVYGAPFSGAMDSHQGLEEIHIGQLFGVRTFDPDDQRFVERLANFGLHFQPTPT